MSFNQDASIYPPSVTCKDNSFLTRPKYELFKMSWKIENFKLLRNVLEYIYSPNFPSDENSDFLFNLRLKMRGQLSLISLSKIKGAAVYAEIFISFTTERKTVPILSFTGILHNCIECKLSFASVCDENAQLLTSDFTFECEIKVLNSLSNYQHGVKEEFSSTKHEDCLVNKLMLNDKLFTDFTFYVQGKEFNIHKVVFAVQSSVFLTLFQSRFTEGSATAIIDDVEPEIFEKLISFLYSGEINENDLVKYAGKILNLAEKYSLDKLKKICATSLYKKLCAENVLESLLLADLHSLVELKKKALFCLFCNKDKFKDSEECLALLRANSYLISEMQLNFVENEKKYYTFLSNSTYKLNE